MKRRIETGYRNLRALRGAASSSVLFARVYQKNDGSGYNETQQLFDMITLNGAKAFGDADSYGTSEDKKADLVVFDAKTEIDALLTLAPRLCVIKNGRVVVKTTPQQVLYRATETWQKINLIE